MHQRVKATAMLGAVFGLLSVYSSDQPAHAQGRSPGVSATAAYEAKPGAVPAKAATPAYVNLKVLPADSNVPVVMAMFTRALGVGCDYCHKLDNYADDSNEHKVKARQMLQMTKELASRFPDSGNDFLKSRYLPFPEGKQYITCVTCHQGGLTPVTLAPPDVPKAPEEKDTGTFGLAASAPPPRPRNPNAWPPAIRGEAQPPRKLVYLPQDTNFFEVMEGLRMSLGVECAFCHVSGEHMEHGHLNDYKTGEGRWDDGNPKKLIARQMIKIVKDANAALGVTNIPLTKLVAGDVPNGSGAVTCYTCHRGNHVPTPQPPLP